MAKYRDLGQELQIGYKKLTKQVFSIILLRG